MADLRWEAGLGRAGVLLRDRQPGISEDPKDFKTSQTESNRRVRDAVATVQAAVVQPAGAITTPSLAPTQKPLPIVLAPDRHHKEAISQYGGYVYVAHDHSAVESDQTPPTNPAYRGAGTTVSSLTDAYNFAVSRLNLLQPGARIAIIPIGGRWSAEPPLTIAMSGIDIIGHGRPSLDMGITIAGLADTLIENVDMRVTGKTIPLSLLLSAPDPTRGIVRLIGSRLYSENTALYSQQQFYAKQCMFEQTMSTYGLDPEHAVVSVDFVPPQTGASEINECEIRSWYTVPESAFGVEHGVLDRNPGGYAILARSMTVGTYTLVSTPGDCLVWPSNWLVLRNSKVDGSLFCDQWQVKHIGCEVHGAVPFASRSGKIYAILRGRPLFDPVNGWYQDVPAWVTFEESLIGSQQIADALAWNGAYPPGVNPATYPGLAYVEMSNCVHKTRWDNSGGSAFSGTRSKAVGLVVNSPTGAFSWPGGWNITTLGSCPTGAGRDFYLE